MAYKISKEFAKRGHEIVVYTSDARDLNSRLDVDSNETVDGIRVQYFRNLSMALAQKLTLFVTPRLIPYANKEVRGFDIVHLHEYTTFQNIIVAHYARKYGVPYLLQAHGSLPRVQAKQKLKWIYDVFFGKRLANKASKVIALTHVEADQYKRIMGVVEERISVVPNGIDPSDYSNLPANGLFKMKFDIPEDKKVILYLGRIHRMKGIDFLIKGYAYALKKMVLDDTVMVIAGPDGGYLNSVKSLVRLLRLTDRVIFTGLLAEREKQCALIDADLVVYPGSVEPFGLVTLEAAALSKPVIVSNNTPMASIISRGEFGFSVEYGDVKDLAARLGKIIGDGNLRERLGKNGRRYVFSHFNWKEITGKIETIYQSVTDRSNAVQE